MNSHELSELGRIIAGEIIDNFFNYSRDKSKFLNDIKDAIESIGDKLADSYESVLREEKGLVPLYELRENLKSFILNQLIKMNVSQIEITALFKRLPNNLKHGFENNLKYLMQTNEYFKNNESIGNYKLKSLIERRKRLNNIPVSSVRSECKKLGIKGYSKKGRSELIPQILKAEYPEF
jgi:hypothetical protein